MEEKNVTSSAQIEQKEISNEQLSSQKPKSKLIKPTLILLFFFILGIAGILIFFLSLSSRKTTVSNNSYENLNEEISSSPTPTKHPTVPEISVTKFDEGKLAFTKNGDIYISKGDGIAKSITKDGVNNYPKWSQNGKYLAFRGKDKIKIYNGESLLEIPDGGYSFDHNHFWDNNNLIYFNGQTSDHFKARDGIYSGMAVFKYNPVVGKSTKLGDVSAPYDQCGGGPPPAYLQNLQHDLNTSRYNGLRTTSIYLEDTNSVILSNGDCYNRAMTINSLKDDSYTDFSNLYTTEDSLIPSGLILSPNKKILAGSYKDNIYLFDLNGKTTKALTSSNYAHNPVFSDNNNYLYYINNLKLNSTHVGEVVNPSLMKIDINNSDTKSLYESSFPGAIGSIIPNSKDDKVVFSLIKFQEAPNDDDFVGSAETTIMLLDTLTKNVTPIVENADQPDWWTE